MAATAPINRCPIGANAALNSITSPYAGAEEAPVVIIMTRLIRVFRSGGLNNQIIQELGRQLGFALQNHDERVATFKCVDDAEHKRHLLARLCEEHGLDYAVLSPDSALSRYRLLALDMDSTLITMECIVELATLAGVGADVARLTEAAIQGEAPDYAQSMKERVQMLRGLHRDDILEMVTRKLVLSAGAVELVSAAKAAGLHVLVVSGGFQIVAQEVTKRLGIHKAFAHELEFENDRLTGRLPGSVIDSEGKARILRAYCGRHHISPGEVIAIGDGANDIGMAEFAGLFVGFRPKPALRRFCSVVLDRHGLDGLLLAVGAA